MHVRSEKIELKTTTFTLKNTSSKGKPINQYSQQSETSNTEVRYQFSDQFHRNNSKMGHNKPRRFKTHNSHRGQSSRFHQHERFSVTSARQFTVFSNYVSFDTQLLLCFLLQGRRISFA